MLRKKALDQIIDNRVHCLLYFFGGQLKKIDFKLIRKVETLVNVIPIISMGDSYSKSELIDYKTKLAAMSLKQNTNFFNCKDSLESSASRLLNSFSLCCPPFTILNPNEIRHGVPGRLQIDGNFIRADSKSLDYQNLVEIVFKKLPEQLISTTDILAQEIISDLDKSIKKDERQKQVER